MRLALLVLLGACGFTPATSSIARDAPPMVLDAPADAAPDAQPANLIAYYPMDELPMVDATGHGHDGTCTACPNSVGSGQVAKAFSFNNARVDVASAADLRTETGTIAAWVVFDATPSAGQYACPFGVVYTTIPNGNTWQLCLRDSTQWAVFMQTQSGDLVHRGDPGAERRVAPHGDHVEHDIGDPLCRRCRHLERCDHAAGLRPRDPDVRRRQARGRHDRRADARPAG